MLRVARCECLSYAVSDASASRLAVQKCCVYTVAVSGYIVALFVASGTIIFGSWCPPPIVGIVGDNPFGEYTRRHKSCIRSHRSPCNFPICWHFGSCILSPHLFRLCQSCGLCPGADLFGTPPISRPLFRSCPPPRFHDRVHCLVSEAFAVPRTNRCRDRRRPFELRSVAR